MILIKKKELLAVFGNPRLWLTEVNGNLQQFFEVFRFVGIEFHSYLRQLRVRYTTNTRKLCMILKIQHITWSKIERGINPPPKPSVLKHFSRIVGAKSYEETQMLALARRWKPSKNTNCAHNLLLPPESAIPILGEAEYTRRVEAAMEANKPDYEHRHFKPVKDKDKS